MANGNQFSGLSGIVTSQTLQLQEQARKRVEHAQRLATLGPQTTLAMQFGEALGNFIRQRAGWITPDERRAASNTEVLAQGMDAAMERIEQDELTLGSPEAQRIILEERLKAAWGAKNLEVADAVHEQLMAFDERAVMMNKLKAETADIGADNRRADRDSALAEKQLNMQGKQFHEQMMVERDKLRIMEGEAIGALEAAVADDAKDRAAMEDDLRAEIDEQIMPVAQQFSSVKSMENVLMQGTRAGDISAVFKFLKILDPESTVREGEFDNVASATNYILSRVEKGEVDAAAAQTINKLANKYLTGEAFTDYGRAQLINAARGSLRGDLSTAMGRIEAMEGIATRRELNLDNIYSGNVNTVKSAWNNVQLFGEQDLSALANNRTTLKGLLQPGNPSQPTWIQQQQTPMDMSGWKIEKVK